MWLEHIWTKDQFTHSGGAPHQATLICEINLSVWRIIHAISAQMKLRR